MNYYPDRWMLIEVNHPNGEKYYKVFGSFFGGYTSGNSWRMNSGVTHVEETDDALLFKGNSGSVYVCGKHTYGAHSYGYSVIKNYEKQHSDIIRILSEDEAKEVITKFVEEK